MNLPRRRSDPNRPENFWWERTAIHARSHLRAFPFLHRTLGWVWRATKLLILKGRGKVIKLTGALAGIQDWRVDFEKVCWVPPERITFCSLQEFDLRTQRGCVIGGDWDRLEEKFEDLDVFVALKEVMLDGKKWPETIFYRRILDEIAGGKVLWDCANKSDFDLRCKEIEDLYHQVRQGGYKCQRELVRSGSIPRLVETAEVTVSIGRDGDLLFSDGAHRLSIAKLLGISPIPIQIAVRHTEWATLRKRLLRFAEEEGGILPQPVTHPDLSDLPASQACHEVFAIVRASMSANHGSLLDIGAELGYYCHRFEDEGFECYALEQNPTQAWLLSKLKRAENKRFKVLSYPVSDCIEIRGKVFGFVLAFKVLHNVLRTKEEYENLVGLLNILQTNELFLELERAGKSESRTVYRSFSISEFLQFLLENSRLARVECVGITKHGTSVYRLH